MEAAYQHRLDSEFMRMADVHLIVADKTYPAHSQFLSAESGVLRAGLLDTEPAHTAKQPWITRNLDGYSSGTVESFLYSVYNPPLFHATAQAWEMMDIADHLDCKRLLEAARAALECVDGQCMHDTGQIASSAQQRQDVCHGHLQETSVVVTRGRQGFQ